MKDLLRFEPYYDGSLFSHNGKIFLVKNKLQGNDLNECTFIDRSMSVVPYNGLSSPIKVQIQFTNRCNFFCPHCYVSSRQVLSDEMDDNQIIDVLHKLRDFGVLQIEWSGGEVFSRKNFLPIARYTQELGFEQMLLTNGFAIAKSNFNIAELWELFTDIQISIDGFDEGFNNWVGKNAWQNVKKSVDDLYQIKPKDSRLLISTTLDLRNLSDLSKIAEWIDGKNIIWKLGKQIISGRSTINEEVNEEILNISYLEIQKLRSLFAIDANHPYDKTTPDNQLLPIEWHTENGARWFMYIKANGDVYPFPYWDGKTQFFAGNILNESIEKIWYSKEFDYYRSASREMSLCSDCSLVCSMWAKSFSSYNKDLFSIPEPHQNCPRLKT